MLTDNGMAFADLPKYRDGPTARWMGHIFNRVCDEHGIEHRLTKPYHPWTNGQAERMNRTVKDATIKAFHYPSLDALKAHVLVFVQTYNFAKHLKALKWRTPFQAICDAWTKSPSTFKINPHHLIPGPNTARCHRERGAGGRPGAGVARVVDALYRTQRSRLVEQHGAGDGAEHLRRDVQFGRGDAVGGGGEAAGALTGGVGPGISKLRTTHSPTAMVSSHMPTTTMSVGSPVGGSPLIR